MGMADDDSARITYVQGTIVAVCLTYILALVTQREANGPPAVPPRPRSALME